MKNKLKSPGVAAALFDGWEETIIRSCLEGVMGAVYADNTEKPRSAMAHLGDFCFFAGVPDAELVRFKPDRDRHFMIMVPQSDEWAGMIKNCYGENAREITRYAIKKEKGIFDRAKLTAAAGSLPNGFALRGIDEALYDKCLENAWSRDLVSNYSSYGEYEKLGLGVVILKNGELASGASAYSRYRDGIEIEIDTREEYRRQGLAYACGAMLILECCNRNLYPSWDAHNLHSVALAEKLGYHFSHEYKAFEVHFG